MAKHRPKHDHERTDFGARTPMLIAVGMLVLVVVSITAVVVAMNSVWAPPEPGPQVFESGARPGSFAKLQTDPQADFAKLQKHWQQQLHSYGWVDRDAGIVRVPIDVAIERLAKQGLPGRDQAPGVVRDSLDKPEAKP